MNLTEEPERRRAEFYEGKPKAHHVPIMEFGPEIVGIEDAPAFLIDNKNLRRGYRKNFRKTSDILRSLWIPHNETLNIWTHLIGAVVTIWAVVFVMGRQTPYDAIGPQVEKSLQTPATRSELVEFWQKSDVCKLVKALDWNDHVSKTHSGIVAGDKLPDRVLHHGLLAAACGYMSWITGKSGVDFFVEQAEQLIFGLADKLKSPQVQFDKLRNKLRKVVSCAVEH